MNHPLQPRNNKCSVSGDKHKWAWERNGLKTSGSGGSLGGSVHIQAKGIYRCICGKLKFGNVLRDAPGADVRDHIEK